MRERAARRAGCRSRSSCKIGVCAAAPGIRLYCTHLPLSRRARPAPQYSIPCNDCPFPPELSAPTQLRVSYFAPPAGPAPPRPSDTSRRAALPTPRARLPTQARARCSRGPPATWSACRCCPAMLRRCQGRPRRGSRAPVSCTVPPPGLPLSCAWRCCCSARQCFVAAKQLRLAGLVCRASSIAPCWCGC